MNSTVNFHSDTAQSSEQGTPTDRVVANTLLVSVKSSLEMNDSVWGVIEQG